MSKTSKQIDVVSDLAVVAKPNPLPTSELFSSSRQDIARSASEAASKAAR